MIKQSKQYKSKRVVMLTVFVTIAVLFSSCTTFNSFRQTFLSDGSNDTYPSITIGVIEPQTGRYAKKGKDEIKGIELANSIYNNVDGYKVNLVKVDTQSSVSATETSIQALIEMKPVAIIGTAGEASSLTISDYIDEAKIPAITPSATNPLITQNSNYYFRACLTDPQMGEGLAEYAYERKGSGYIGIVSIKNDTGASALIEGFDDKIEELAGKRSRAVATTDYISADEKEMKAALKDMRSKSCDYCLVTMGTEEMNTFFTIVEDMDLTNMTFMGPRSWGDESFVAMMDKHPDIKVVFPYESVLTKNDDTSDTYTEEAQRFQIEYANRYGSDDIPTDNAALGYDSYLLLINAIHNAKSLEGSQIRAAMRDFSELKCATGLFTFDDTGNVIRSVTLSTIKDGKPVTEYVTNSEAKARKLEDVETVTGEEE